MPDPKLAADLFWSMVSGALFWPQLFEGPMTVKVRKRITAEVVETLQRSRDVQPA